MRNGIATVVLIGALAAPMAGAAAAGRSSGPGAAARQRPSKPAVPDHAVSGAVKAVDAKRLVITRVGKKPAEMTFELRPSTQREGAIAVGKAVEIRYRTEGHSRVATAIVATPRRQPTAKGVTPWQLK